MKLGTYFYFFNFSHAQPLDVLRLTTNFFYNTNSAGANQKKTPPRKNAHSLFCYVFASLRMRIKHKTCLIYLLESARGPEDHYVRLEPS